MTVKRACSCALSKRNKSLANSEDESEDDLRLLGISHPKGTPSSLKILRSELELKEGGFLTLVQERPCKRANL